ncbi:MAG TPA: c-type cytochrome biogenesis protein CcmI [Pyrinomonadaceae bacterium]|nr:c-type cytochrome biogenesis protein CcmI [Pyrinomonadaceae bacterium]
MILFWLICAGLAAIALAFVLPTLLQRPAEVNENKTEANVEIYRDQLRELEADLANGIVSPEQYRQDRDEIERRLLDDVADATEAGKTSANATSDRAVVYAVAFGMPVGALVLYLLVGTSAALSGVPPQAATRANSNAAQMTQQGIEANVAALAKRLEQNPNNAEGWTMLGRSYINLEKYREASDAYAKASALKTQDADILVEYAFALAMANGRQLQGQPTELVRKALQIAPENPRALELAGSAEFEAKNYKQAIVHWQKLLEKSSGDSELTQTISERINEAKALAGATAK